MWKKLLILVSYGYVCLLSKTASHDMQRNDTFTVNGIHMIPSFEWLWLNGNNVGNQHTEMTHQSGRDMYLYPGAKAGMSSWSNKNGQVWVFGGKGYNHEPTDEATLLNDLWNFDCRTKEWHKISNKTMTGSFAPKPRWKASMCGVGGIMLVLFGGEDKEGLALHDTWVYDIPKSMWIPINGVMIRQNPSVSDSAKPAGIATNESKLHYPSPRYSAVTWCIGKKMIIFGGLGPTMNVLTDMWEFSLETLVWKVRQQYSSTSEVLGTSLFPPGRYGAGGWVGHNHTLYMYGGSLRPDAGKSENLRAFIAKDMWYYLMGESTWKPLSSSLFTQQLPYYNLLGIASNLSNPGSRRHSVMWTSDEHQYLWLFGGEGSLERDKKGTSSVAIYSDLWKYDMDQRLWFWMGGTKNVGLSMYGMKAVEAESNFPGARLQSVAWSYNNLTYMFGGYGFDARNVSAFLNDLWLLIPENSTFMFQRELSWFQTMPPGTVFLISLGSVGGVAVAFGAAFFIKKMIDYPRSKPSRGFNIKYSRIAEEKIELDFDIVMDEL